MADQRALDAVRRIERALARIEAAAERPQPAAAPALADAPRRLRSRVESAIGELDRLIGDRR